jgi:methylisocitrate lyase
MTQNNSPGNRFRAAVQAEQPLQVMGVINAFCALLAQRAGFHALYLSGAGVANASHGLPDLGITTPDDVLEDAKRITAASDLPLLVDIDTGFGGAFNIARTVRQLDRAGVAAIHIEDQVATKRCGHRPGKKLVSDNEMADRVKAALDARLDHHFVVMARTDAYSVEGLDRAIQRAQCYTDAGADMIFAEAMTTLDEYQQFTQAVSVPVLANVTEFGKTPMFTTDQLHNAGVALALYPLSAFRAMNAAAQRVFETIKKQGTQISLLDQMQNRDQLYDVLGYHDYEKKLDNLFGKEQQQDER